MHCTILVSQVYWYMYISQVSGERIQDHWSSGFPCHIVGVDLEPDCSSWSLHILIFTGFILVPT